MPVIWKISCNAFSFIFCREKLSGSNGPRVKLIPLLWWKFLNQNTLCASLYSWTCVISRNNFRKINLCFEQINFFNDQDMGCYNVINVGLSVWLLKSLCFNSYASLKATSQIYHEIFTKFGRTFWILLAYTFKILLPSSLLG